MEIEISVLVKLKATGHLLSVSPVLNRLQGDGMMRKLGGTFM